MPDADLVREVSGAAGDRAESSAGARRSAGSRPGRAGRATDVDMVERSAIAVANRAVSYWRSYRRAVLPEHLARLSPVAHGHVIPSGTYHFERASADRPVIDRGRGRGSPGLSVAPPRAANYQLALASCALPWRSASAASLQFWAAKFAEHETQSERFVAAIPRYGTESGSPSACVRSSLARA